jgi:hypothetical protein
LEIKLRDAGSKKTFALITEQGLIWLAAPLPREERRGLRPTSIALQELIENGSAQAELTCRPGYIVYAKPVIFG